MEGMIQTSSWFWVIIFGYFALVLGFGSFFARYNKTTQDFFFSGRRFSWWLVTMSIVATGVGSHSFLKYDHILRNVALLSKLASKLVLKKIVQL